MIILPEYKIAFVEIPRTASQAMKRFLRICLGGEAVPYPTQHFCPLPAECEDYKIMCGVRNPYARFYSVYARLLRRNLNYKKPFREAIQHGLALPIMDFLVAANVAKADVVVRFEDLPSSFFQALQALGLPVEGELAQRGESTSSGWREFYTQERADMVWRAALSDFEIYGYERDSWK